MSIYLTTRNVERHISPFNLDFWPSDPKINRGHLLVMATLHVKYEDSVINGISDNQRKPHWSTDRHTDRPTDLPTDISKTIYPLSSSKGGIIKMYNIYRKSHSMIQTIQVPLYISKLSKQLRATNSKDMNLIEILNTSLKYRKHWYCKVLVTVYSPH